MTKGMFNRLATIPVPAILFMLALGLFIIGAYLVSPWYVGSAAVNYTFDNQRPYEIGMGVLYMLLGSSGIIGRLLKSSWLVSFSPTIVMMGYLFLALLRIVVVGWTPITWLPLLLLAVIAAICRLALMLGRG